MAKRSEQAQKKKRAKHRRRREQAKAKARARELPRSLAGLIKMGAAAPLGPAWVSASYDDPDQPHALVTVLVTRRLRGGRFLPATALVDRACLGVKDGFVMEPAGESELEQRVRELSRQGETLLPCEPLVAQSVVFHALDYARELGFAPHPDFPRALFEPRPDVLLDTPGAHPERPTYWRGPNDDVISIKRRLDRTLGRGNYDFVLEQADDDLDLHAYLDRDDYLDLDSYLELGAHIDHDLDDEPEDELEDHGELERGAGDERNARRRDEAGRSR